jgi:UPF0716 protein FxsA
LLLTPGFITDLMGFFCLIPWSRRILAWKALKRFTVVTPAGPDQKPTDKHHPRTLEGEFHREDD